jgi:hypothetical protein
MTVTGIQYNYYPGSLNGEYPERYVEEMVGYRGVAKIDEHPAGGEGDKWFYDVHYDNGYMTRIFNPHIVFFAPEKLPAPDTQNGQ